MIPFTNLNLVSRLANGPITQKREDQNIRKLRSIAQNIKSQCSGLVNHTGSNLKCLNAALSPMFDIARAVASPTYLEAGLQAV